MKLPETVLNFLEIFNKHGFSAYVAGGAVRDGVCGVEPSDYDVATSARVEDTRSLFPAEDVFEFQEQPAVAHHGAAAKADSAHNTQVIWFYH